MIDLHDWPAPNGKKVTILLEELGLPYTVVPCDIGKGDQFKDGFLKSRRLGKRQVRGEVSFWSG
jgi:GST-like protein